MKILQKSHSMKVTKNDCFVRSQLIGRLQVVEAGSDDSLSNDEDATTRKRRDILTRRPSYRKILNDLGGAEITGSKTAFFKTFGLFCFYLS
jgi:hypothetical protein